jgi:hypothetical protein
MNNTKIHIAHIARHAMKNIKTKYSHNIRNGENNTQTK